MLGDGDAAIASQLPRDALGVDPRGTRGAGGGEHIARSLPAHAVVARAQLRDLRGLIWEVGELMHDRVGDEADDRLL